MRVSSRDVLLSGLVLAVFGMLIVFASCGGGSGPSPRPTPTITPTPTPTPIACGTPAPSNPPGGGGTLDTIVVDPAAWGTADVSQFTVYAFSQVNPGDAADAEVLGLAPDLVPRAWGKWDRDGVLPQDYDFTYITQAKAVGTTLIGGTTASALFRDEFGTEQEFMNAVSCDTMGRPVLHDFGGTRFYRGSLASPSYRQYLVQIGKTQIDGGTEGLFYDEPDSSFQGATYDGNEGFDNAAVADFGGFLCAKHPNLTAAQWEAQFGITAGDHLDCTLSVEHRGRGFDYRGYLARHGWQASPLSGANPLAVEWGRTIAGHPDPSARSFVQTYPAMVYWQDIALQLRTYARQTYGREIYLTVNGVFPFVDFQSIGLWDYNPDGPGGSSADYVPVTQDGHFDGSVSWLDTFERFRDRSDRVAGKTVPVSIFQDWPTGNMDRYYALPPEERRDYVRMFAAEAYASGVYFALPLRTSMPNDPTAVDLQMMPLFQELKSFYKAHAGLYPVTAVQGVAVVAIGGSGNVAANGMQLPDGTTVLHVINHNYSRGFQPKSNVFVSFSRLSAPAEVRLVSPDQESDVLVTSTYSDGMVNVTIPQLVSYVAIVAK